MKYKNTMVRMQTCAMSQNVPPSLAVLASNAVWYGQEDMPGDENTFPNSPPSSRRKDCTTIVNHNGNKAILKQGKNMRNLTSKFMFLI